MEFFDVVFPINLGPLTYRCNRTLSDFAKPGMIVSAPLKNKIGRGVIIGKSLAAMIGDVKDIQEIYGDAPVLSSKMINLLRWMSEYYLTEKGLVLKNMLPREAYIRVKQRKKRIPRHPPFFKGGYPFRIVDVDSGVVSGLMESIHKNTYRTFLLHAPSSAHEYSFLLKILSETKNAILLIPEVSLIHDLYLFLHERFGERVCLFHSELSKGKRSEVVERILSGHSDIVLGTRSAVFAPLKKVSLIAVLNEHDASYKQKSAPCYSARDVAVKRGYFERATVLLSSICPSIESFYNCGLGKYTLLKLSDDGKKPRVRVIDMSNEKLLKPYLSKVVLDASVNYIKDDKKVMFVINRRGYSTVLQCPDCSYIAECPDCRIPLVFHKQDMSMKCHYCGYAVSDIPEYCIRCKGYNMQLLGAGTQRVQEDIEGFIGIKTLRLDSDKAQKRSDIEKLLMATMSGDVKIIVGTKLMTKRLGLHGGFSMAAIMNTDIPLHMPDFRSAEKIYQEISSIINTIEPHGEIFIQTRMPQNYLFKYLKNYDYTSFFREELQRRKSLHYPPYSKLLIIRCITKRDISKELSEIIERADKDVEILGPFISKNPRYRNDFRLLLRSSVRRSLHCAAGIFIETFKDSKDVKTKVDVDPISID